MQSNLCGRRQRCPGISSTLMPVGLLRPAYEPSIPQPGLRCRRSKWSWSKGPPTDGAPEGTGETRTNPFRVPGWYEDDFLLGWRTKRTLWVRAPGYSWKRAGLEISRWAGEQTVLLDAQPFDSSTIRGRVVVRDGDRTVVPRAGWIRIDLDNFFSARTVRVVEGEWTPRSSSGRRDQCHSRHEAGRTPRALSWEPSAHLERHAGLDRSTLDTDRCPDRDRCKLGRGDREDPSALRGRLEPRTTTRSPPSDLAPAPVTVSAWHPDEYGHGLGWPFVRERVWWGPRPGLRVEARFPSDHGVERTHSVELPPEGALQVKLSGDGAAQVEWLALIPAGTPADEDSKVLQRGTRTDPHRSPGAGLVHPSSRGIRLPRKDGSSDSRLPR